MGEKRGMVREARIWGGEKIGGWLDKRWVLGNGKEERSLKGGKLDTSSQTRDVTVSLGYWRWWGREWREMRSWDSEVILHTDGWLLRPHSCT